MPAATPSVVADTPEPDQGETAEKPIPAPNARSISDKAAITTAPAATAPQEMPASEDSAEMLSGMVVGDMGKAASPERLFAKSKFGSRVKVPEIVRCARSAALAKSIVLRRPR
jgi:hypothetical protein